MTPVRDTLFGFAAAAFFVSVQVHAEATVVNMKGDVRDHGAPVTLGHRVLPGTTLTTGAGAQAHLRFSDRQQIVLDQNTAFRITDFHYSAHEPQGDRATFDLQRGAVRFISGAIGARNPGVVALRTSQATYSVRGTDFMVALVNPAYLKVLEGAVGVTNFGGTVVFGADSAAAVASASAIAQPVFVTRLPATASGPFSTLAAVPTGMAVMQADVSGVAGAATRAAPSPGIDVRSAIKLGIYAALIGAALSGGSSATTHH